MIKAYFLNQDNIKDSTETGNHSEKLVLGDGPTPHLKNGLNLGHSLISQSIKFKGHKGVITSLSLNFDSSYFISGSSDQEIRLWNTQSGICLARYKAHLKTIWNVKLAPRGFYFASSCSDSVIFLWSTNTHKPLKRFEGHTEEITCMEFTKNMIYLVTSSYDKSVRIWNLDDRELARVFYFNDFVTCFDLNEVGEILVCGDEQGMITVWNVAKAYILIKFKFTRNSDFSDKSIRGVNLSFDENTILIFNRSTLSYYNFRNFKQEISKDVFSKENPNVNQLDRTISPLQTITAEEFDFQKILFNMRNVLISFSKLNRI